jgi:pyridoxal phosphate enzyme (YggS family)
VSAWPNSKILEEVAERLKGLQTRVEAACLRANRDPAEVTLVGACKRQPIERIAAAINAGLVELGPNYVQEADSVRPELEALLSERNLPLPRWSMIGHLQSNKARQALQCFDKIDSVDRIKLARQLNDRAQKNGLTLEVGLQVNVSGEAQKAGVEPAETPALLEACSALPALRVVGLMTLPAADPERARQAFRQLRQLRDTLRQAPAGRDLQQLSMGMSGDFEIAIEEGATHVRIGSALFGERSPVKQQGA